jgi:hypothetical protein
VEKKRTRSSIYKGHDEKQNLCSKVLCKKQVENIPIKRKKRKNRLKNRYVDIRRKRKKKKMRTHNSLHQLTLAIFFVPSLYLVLYVQMYYHHDYDYCSCLKMSCLSLGYDIPACTYALYNVRCNSRTIKTTSVYFFSSDIQSRIDHTC